MPLPRSLGDQILAAFKQAQTAQRADVAEHLLRALETLEKKPKPGSTLAEAYFTLVGSVNRKARQQNH